MGKVNGHIILMLNRDGIKLAELGVGDTFGEEALISDAQWTGLQTAAYVLAAVVCGWIPALLAPLLAEARGRSD